MDKLEVYASQYWLHTEDNAFGNVNRQRLRFKYKLNTC